MVYIRSTHIKQIETVGKVKDPVFLIQPEIILPLRIQQISAVQVFAKFLLFFLPATDLLIRPCLDILAYISGQKIHCLIEAASVCRGGVVHLDTCLLRHLKDINQMRQVVLRVAESQRTAQFMRLPAVGLYLSKNPFSGNAEITSSAT